MGAPQLLGGLCEPGMQFASRVNCEVMIDVPAECAFTANANCPLVFLFHGHAGNNKEFYSGDPGKLIHSGVFPIIGIFPQGTDYAGKSGWNTGVQMGVEWDCQNRDCSRDPNDMAFVMAIVDKLGQMGHSGRRYAIGHSNGAALSQRIGVNGAMGFSGIVVHATQLTAKPERSGPGPYNYNYPTLGSQTKAIAVLALHGSADMVIPMGGGPLFGSPVFSLATAYDSVALWAKVAMCNGIESVNQFSAAWFSHPHGIVSGKGTETSYSCPATTPVRFLLTSCAGHGGTTTKDGLADEKIGHSSDLTYALLFVTEVEAACAADPARCANAPVYSQPTTFPPYVPPTCVDRSYLNCPCDFTAGVITNDHVGVDSTGITMCSVSCSNMFVVCSQQTRNYRFCRSQIDQGSGLLMQPPGNCQKSCQDTPPMLAERAKDPTYPMSMAERKSAAEAAREVARESKYQMSESQKEEMEAAFMQNAKAANLKVSKEGAEASKAATATARATLEAETSKSSVKGGKRDTAQMEGDEADEAL